MLTAEEQALCAERPNEIDYDRLQSLHYLGNYVRPLAVNLDRMMENAYDWEHLPFVHPSSFASIECTASGPWGWRAKVGLPDASGGGHQLIDLLVDQSHHYWATTVINGVGQGTEIHTQATAVGENQIEVDVRFYIPQAPDTDDTAAFLLDYLRGQYATLYDEDLDLMSGRQQALERKAKARSGGEADRVRIGSLHDLDRTTPIIVDLPGARACVRYVDGQWIVHNAVCPHLLGPLDKGDVNADGHIICPWHGYAFDPVSGRNIGGACRNLDPVGELVQEEGSLILVPISEL